jgi:hypothetical protein
MKEEKKIKKKYDVDIMYSNGGEVNLKDYDKALFNTDEQAYHFKKFNLDGTTEIQTVPARRILAMETTVRIIE